VRRCSHEQPGPQRRHASALDRDEVGELRIGLHDPAYLLSGGEIHYWGECPTCGGSGEIDDSGRDGVSLFPAEEGLYRYVLRRRGNLGGALLVELEGEPTGDEDFDAGEGALLIRPTRIVDPGPRSWATARRRIRRGRARTSERAGRPRAPCAS
jgi:hypothetical protein